VFFDKSLFPKFSRRFSSVISASERHTMPFKNKKQIRGLAVAAAVRLRKQALQVGTIQRFSARAWW
jgi:hypothetical protein